MARAAKILKVVQDPEAEVPTEVIAQAIADIADSMRRINAGRLTRKAIVTLLADDTKLGKGTVETVLMSLTDLEKTYLKK